MRFTPLAVTAAAAADAADWKVTSPLSRGLWVDDDGAGCCVGGWRLPLNSFLGVPDDDIW